MAVVRLRIMTGVSPLGYGPFDLSKRIKAMLFISLTLSAILLVAVGAVGSREPDEKVKFTILTGVIGVLVGLTCLQSFAFLVNAFLVVGLAVACKLCCARPLIFWTGAIATTVLCYALVGYSEFSRLRELQQSYPLEPLGDRLAYEARRRPAGHQHQPGVPPRDSKSEVETPGVSSALDFLESSLDSPDSHLRWIALRRLHEGFVDEFIASPGFGVTRRLRPSNRAIDLAAVEPIALPSSADDDPSKSAVAVPGPFADSPGFQTSGPTTSALLHFHSDSLLDFVNQDGFGYLPQRRLAAGFQVHQFRHVPVFWSTEPPETQRWRLRNLELVSLLKFDEPRVYLSEHLPRMDELQDAPTRPLDDFEKEALAALRNGQDVVDRTVGNRLRMLGSIRAFDKCLWCHEGERGDLLGVFSYQLRQDPTAH
jgi:hypothetical protein